MAPHDDYSYADSTWSLDADREGTRVLPIFVLSLVDAPLGLHFREGGLVYASQRAVIVLQVRPPASCARAHRALTPCAGAEPLRRVARHRSGADGACGGRAAGAGERPWRDAARGRGAGHGALRPPAALRAVQPSVRGAAEQLVVGHGCVRANLTPSHSHAGRLPATTHGHPAPPRRTPQPLLCHLSAADARRAHAVWAVRQQLRAQRRQPCGRASRSGDRARRRVAAPSALRAGPPERIRGAPPDAAVRGAAGLGARCCSGGGAPHVARRRAQVRCAALLATAP